MQRNHLARGLVLAAALSLAGPAAYAGFNASLLPKLAKGGAVKFQALMLRDFAKGGKLPKGSDQITINGKKITYAKFLQTLNSLKRRMNAAGHRLRKGRALVKGDVKVDRRSTGRAARIRAMHKPGQAMKALKVGERLARFFERTRAIRDPKFAATVAKKYPNMFRFLKHAAPKPVKK